MMDLYVWKFNPCIYQGKGAWVKMIKNPVKKNFEDNISYLHTELGVGKSFDVIQLDLEYAERRMALFLIDGLVKDDLLHLLMKFLAKVEKDQLEPDVLNKLMKTSLPYVEISKEEDMDIVVDTVLAGPSALVIEGVDQIILIDARTYPVRGPQEPDIERVVRGARDGFV